MKRFFSLLIREFKKGVKNIFQKLEKLLNEIFGFGDEVADSVSTPAERRVKEKQVEQAERAARKNGESDYSWMSIRKTGNLGGNILKKFQIRKLRGILKEKGIDLIVEGDIRSVKKLFKPVIIDDFRFENVDDLFFFMKRKKFVGGFNAINKQMILPANSTEIVAFHEMAHVKHYELLGDAYHELNVLQKETYVWKEILASRGNWKKGELEDSLEYINRIRTDKKFGLKPIKIK